MEGDHSSIPGLERSPGEGLAIHFSILAWRIPWTEEPAGYSPWGPKESDLTEQIHLNFLNVNRMVLCSQASGEWLPHCSF